MKILIIEDSLILSKNIGQFLELKNIKNKIVHSAESADLILLKERFNLIILDINLPGENGITFCKRLRQKLNNVPIIFLTSRDSQEDLILGFEVGGDDYITKPFDYTELLLRINSLYRRTNNLISTVIKIDNIKVNLEKQEVEKEGKIIVLSNLEFKLLEYFIKNKNIVLNRAEIYENVWGEFERFQLSRSTDIYISRLRKKLGKDFIKTKKGVGYYLEIK